MKGDGSWFGPDYVTALGLCEFPSVAVKKYTLALSLVLAISMTGHVGALAQSVADVPGPSTLNERRLGAPGAPTQIVVFTSFICAECAEWHLTVLPELKTRFVDPGLAEIEFRDAMSVPAQLAAPAAAIARCAAPGRFLDVADALMAGQAAVRADGSVQDWYGAAIDASGKSREDIETCVAAAETRDVIVLDSDLADAYGFEALPGVVVNGMAIRDTSIAGISAAMKAVPSVAGPAN